MVGQTRQQMEFQILVYQIQWLLLAGMDTLLEMLER